MVNRKNSLYRKENNRSPHSNTTICSVLVNGAGETCKVFRSFCECFNSKDVNVNYKIVEMMMKMHIFNIVGGRTTFLAFPKL